MSSTTPPYVVRQPGPLRGTTRYDVHDRATNTRAGSVVKTSVGLKGYVWKAVGIPDSDYPFLTRGRAAAAVWATWRSPEENR